MIEIKHLSKTFQMKDGAVNALKNIDLTIPDGSIYGIIGMSGAGKSTLVRCINLLERPTEGSVVIDGTAMETLSPAALRERRRDITMIFQQFNLLMQRSCLKNICFPMELAGVKKADAEKRARELLEMVGLPDKANAYPAQLSGGQKQRIAIARALATNPKVLLCDEATSALDPNTTHAILTLIKDINKKLGITVVVITHQMSVVEEICDSVAILDGGVVVEQGEVREIFANPKTAAARRLVAPNGGSAARDLSSFAPDDHVVRVTFNGSSAAKPLVASLAAEKGILVSVLSADTRDLSGQCYGSMLLKLPRDTEQAKQAAAYMRSQNGGQRSGHAGDQPGQALRDHDLGDDLERGSAHALGSFHDTLVQLTQTGLHQTGHEGEGRDHQRNDGGLGADGGTHNGTGQREDADHQNQERHAAQNVDDDVQDVHQPARQGQDAVLIASHQQNAQRQAQNQRKCRGEDGHVERLPNGEAIICKAHSPVTSSTVTPGWPRI